MDKHEMERSLRNMGREPRACAEYEQAVEDWEAGRPKRDDWPVAAWTVGRMRYELGWAEAQHGQI